MRGSEFRYSTIGSFATFQSGADGVTAESIVFVVDDDQALRDSLSWLLESVRLPARTFTSAQEFLQFYDRSQPGCLVLDVRMPGLSRLELLDRLVADDAPIPVILLAAHAHAPLG